MKKTTMPQGSGASMRRKLYSALSMLLVSGIMMVTSSYAWFVMSTAPEVKGIQTQVGANGALEIALLNQASWDDLNQLDMGDIDENAGAAAATSTNLTWGNLVNLESATYGLGQITLLPSRLFIEEDATTSDEDGAAQAATYKINNTTLLKTPKYGEDGRVKGLDKAAAKDKIYNGTNGFDTEGKGVRAIGTIANMSTYQLDLSNARSQISTDTSAVRAAASKALNANGGNMADIVVRKALNKAESFPVSDVENILKLAEEIEVSLDHIEDALRQAYAGYLATKAAATKVPNDAYKAALDEINKPETTLTDLATKYPDAISDTAKLSGYVDMLSKMRKKVDDAKTECNKYILDNSVVTVTWEQIKAIILPLINVDNVTVNGNTIDTLQKKLNGEIKDENGDPYNKYTLAMSLMDEGGKLPITMATDSGLLSDIADFAGDYTATVTVKNVQVGGDMGSIPVNVKMSTATTYNPVHLTNSSNELAKQELRGGTAGTAITDFYGYAIDLAFRTNANDSHLLLQTDPKNRIYDDGENEALQGGGSYMTFKTDAGLSATKMVKLMGGVRVVFMDKDQNVLKLAKLDTTLTKEDYTELTEEVKTKLNLKGNTYAYYLTGLNTAGKETNIQKSDLITKDQFDKLTNREAGSTAAVVFDPANGTVTAKLYLYSFSMTKAKDVQTNADGTTTELETEHNTGGITIGNKLTKAEITALEADEPMIVTALVYLDGSVVNNSMVAASALQSMTGTLNLQFSSDVALQPAQNTALKDGEKNNTGG